LREREREREREGGIEQEITSRSFMSANASAAMANK
jgi:hypothetical protein